MTSRRQLTSAKKPCARFGEVESRCKVVEVYSVFVLKYARNISNRVNFMCNICTYPDRDHFWRTNASDRSKLKVLEEYDTTD